MRSTCSSFPLAWWTWSEAGGRRARAGAPRPCPGAARLTWRMRAEAGADRSLDGEPHGTVRLMHPEGAVIAAPEADRRAVAAARARLGLRCRGRGRPCAPACAPPRARTRRRADGRRPGRRRSAGGTGRGRRHRRLCSTTGRRARPRRRRPPRRSPPRTAPPGRATRSNVARPHGSPASVGTGSTSPDARAVAAPSTSTITPATGSQASSGGDPAAAMTAPDAILRAGRRSTSWAARNVPTSGPGALARPSSSIAAATDVTVPPPSGVARPSTPSSASPAHHPVGIGWSAARWSAQ